VAFAEPEGAVEFVPEDEPAPTPEADEPPAVAPSEFQPQGDDIPLENLVPIQAEVRDPHVPFDLVAAVITSPDAIGAELTADPTAHPTFASVPPPKTPQEPFHVATSASLMAASWSPPPDSAKPARPVYPVAVADLMAASYPPALIVLAVNGLVSITSGSSWVISLIILAAVTIMMVPRLRFRVRLVRWIAIGIMAAVAVIFLANAMIDASVYNMDLGVKWWTMLASWGLAVVMVVEQWLGLRYREVPNQTA